MIDSNLTWHDHVSSFSKNLSRKVHQLCRVKHFLNLHTRKVFLHTNIISVISYGSTLFYSASENALKPLLSIYKRAVKAVLLKSTSVVSSDYADLKTLPLKKLFLKTRPYLREKKSMVGNAPQTLESKFQPTPRETNKLPVPVPRIDLFKSSPLDSGCML